MTNFKEVNKKAALLLKANSDYLSRVTAEDKINSYYDVEAPKTKVDLIRFFRSFDDEKLKCDDVMGFNKEAGFTTEYKDAMQ